MYKHTSLAEILKNAGLVNEEQADLTKQIADVDKAYKASQETNKPATPLKPRPVSKPITTATKPVEPVKKDATSTTEPVKVSDVAKKVDEPVKSPADMFKAANKPTAPEPEKQSLFKSLFKPDAADDAQVAAISKNMTDRYKGFADMAKGLMGGGSGQTNTFNVTQQQPQQAQQAIPKLDKLPTVADLGNNAGIDAGTFDNGNAFTNRPFGQQKPSTDDAGSVLAKAGSAVPNLSGMPAPGKISSDSMLETESDTGYQDSLLDILKIAGVPAEERTAPDYEDGVCEADKDDLENVDSFGGDASDGLISDVETNQRGTDVSEETTALQGQYGHSGKLAPVAESPDFLTRLKELSGMIRN